MKLHAIKQSLIAVAGASLLVPFVAMASTSGTSINVSLNITNDSTGTVKLNSVPFPKQGVWNQQGYSLYQGVKGKFSDAKK